MLFNRHVNSLNFGCCCFFIKKKKKNCCIMGICYSIYKSFSQQKKKKIINHKLYTLGRNTVGYASIPSIFGAPQWSWNLNLFWAYPLQGNSSQEVRLTGPRESEQAMKGSLQCIYAARTCMCACVCWPPRPCGHKSYDAMQCVKAEKTMAYRPPILRHTALNKSGGKLGTKKRESKPEPAPCLQHQT